MRSSALVLGLSLHVLAHAQTPAAGSAFDELRLKVAELRPHITEIERQKLELQHQQIQSCDAGLKEPDVQLSQYIYNAFYSWSSVQQHGGYCVYLLGPERRVLDPSEAMDLIDASQMEFPVPDKGNVGAAANVHPSWERHDPMSTLIFDKCKEPRPPEKQ